MKNKLCAYIILLILTVTLASAEITIVNDLKDKYNLGDPIKSSFYVKSSQDVNGLFKLNLFCDNFDIDYFIVLLEMKTGERLALAPPELKPTERMKGNCKLKASLESLDKEILDTFDSNPFEVTDQLSINLNLDKQSVLPGETIKIDGEVISSYDNSDLLSLKLSFDGKQENTSIKEMKFNKELAVDSHIKSGNHILFAESKDLVGNYGDKTINIIVEPKPSKIILVLNKNSFKPEEIAEISPIIYDQADDTIPDKDVLVKILKSNTEIFSETVKSNEKAAYSFLKYAPPGEYIVKSVYDAIKAEEKINVEEIKKLDIRLEGEVVYIKNVGNVNYRDTVNLNLVGEEKSYILNKRIDLEPDKSISINLSEKVQTDNYDVAVSTTEETTSLGSNITIKDKRSLMGLITGAVIAAKDGIISSKPLFASFLMIIIIASLVIFFIRKRKRERSEPKLSKYF